MRYTDQDVEEVINAYFVSYRTSKNARGQTADASTVHRKAHEQGVRAARAALEAMEREPTRNPHTGLTVEEAWLEIADDMRDVLIERQHELDDQANTSRQLPYATLSGVWVSWDSYYVPDYGCYEAETVEAELNEASEAIRNAVAAANEGR